MMKAVVGSAGCFDSAGGGGGGGGGGNAGTCGPGTHRDTNGVCQLDPAYLIVFNQGGNQYWKGFPGTSNAQIDLQLSLTSTSDQNPSGSGEANLYLPAPNARFPNEFVPGTTTAITFAEGSSIDSMQIHGGPSGLTELSAITLLSDTQFTANVTTSGGSPNYNFNLASGSF
jgi:hypothetical protein